MHKEKYKNVYERFLNVFFMGVLGNFEMGVGILVIFGSRVFWQFGDFLDFFIRWNAIDG